MEDFVTRHIVIITKMNKMESKEIVFEKKKLKSMFSFYGSYALTNFAKTVSCSRVQELFGISFLRL